MTELWMTAQAIAERALPGLPTTKAKIIARADREGWSSRPRTGRGGGKEYSVTALPKAAREALLSSLAGKVVAFRPADTTPAPLVVPASALEPYQHKPTTGLADWQRQCMDARAAILMEIESLAAIGGQAAAIREVIKRAKEGTLRPDLQALVPIANAKAGGAGKRSLSRASIFNWKAASVEGGARALAPRPQVLPNAGVPLWAPALMRVRRTFSNQSLAAVMEKLPPELPEGVPMPSYGQVRRFLGNVSTVDRERGRHGPNGMLKFKAFKRRSTGDLWPMDVVSADGHTFKADVAHPVHGKPFRPEVCAIMDTKTRYAFGWSAGLAESAHVVMDTIRRGVEHLGAFCILYTDNGSGFVGETMTADVTGLLSRIGATPKNSIPGRAQARGKIERLQGSLWKRAARDLPTYSGRDMDNEARRAVKKLVDADIRAAGTSRLLMSWAEFLEWCAGIVAAYNNRPHRSLPKVRDGETQKLRHMSPAEALDAERAKGWEPEMLPAAITDDLFRPELVRTVARGEITLPWGRYFAQALEAHGGDKVRVAYDIQDGSKVWIRALGDGGLICIAKRDGNVIAEQPASAVEHARQMRRATRLRLIDQKTAEIEAEAGPRLLEMDAVMPMEALNLQAKLEAEFLAKMTGAPAQASRAVTIEETAIPSMPDERFEFWITVNEALRAGMPVSDHQRRWHRSYQGQAEYRAQRDLAASFGAAIPEAVAS